MSLLKSVVRSVFIYMRCATSVLSFSYFLFDCLANPMLALEKQPTFCDATTGFPAQMTSVSEERPQKFHTWRVTAQIWGAPLIGRSARKICFNQSIRSTTQKSTQSYLVVTRHQYLLVSQSSFWGETSGCWLFFRLMPWKSKMLFAKIPSGTIDCFLVRVHLLTKF